MKTALISVVCILVAGMCPWRAYSNEDIASYAGQSLYVSFDNPGQDEKKEGHIYYADYCMGDRQSMAETARSLKKRTVTPVKDGRFGAAASGSIVFDAEGHFLPAKGTISMWYRAHGPESRPVVTVGGLDEADYGRLLWTQISGQGAEVILYDREGNAHAVETAGLNLEQNKWHHLAIAWDQAQGASLYLDGRRVGTTWGKDSWNAPANPSGIGLGGGFSFELMANSLPGGTMLTDLDELRVFHYPLSQEQISRLYEDNQPPLQLPETEWTDRHISNRLQEYGYDHESELPAMDHNPHVLTRLAPISCVSVGKPTYAPLDGRRGCWKGVWPFIYQWYLSQEVQGLDIEFSPPAMANLVTIIGSFEGSLLCRATTNGRPASIPIRGVNGCKTFSLKEPAPANYVKALWSKGHIKELGVYYFRTNAVLPAAAGGPLWWLTSSRPPAQNVILPGHFPISDRTCLVGVIEQPKKDVCPLRPLWHLHLISGPLETNFPLDAVRIRLLLANPAEAGKIHVVMRNPADPRAEVICTDLYFRGGRELDLTLDPPDVIAQPQDRLWIDLVFEKEVQIETGKSFMQAIASPRQKAMAEHIRQQTLRMSELFFRCSEGRPFSYGLPRKESARQYKMLGELCAAMDDLRAHDPGGRELREIQEWVYDRGWRDEGGLPFAYRAISLEDVKGPGNVPAWALLERELLSLCRNWAAWWIDNRQDVNGEFQGGFNDDTDLVQGWANLVFISDEDGKIRNSLSRLAEAGYRLGAISNGLNSVTKDTLHAYEDGINMLHLMAATQYGHPLWIERIMETCRQYERLTELDKDGKRHFIGRTFGARDVQRGRDDASNAMMFQPGLCLLWYNRNPAVEKKMLEWADSWLAAKPVPGADETIFTSTAGLDMEFLSFMLGLHELTGENRLLAAYADGQGLLLPDPRYSFPDWLMHTPAGRKALDDKKWVQRLCKNFQNKARVMSDGHNYLCQDVPYASWYATGSKEYLEHSLAGGVEFMRRYEWALTAGNQSTDRVPVPMLALARMMLGGAAGERSQLWHTQAVSWENTGGQMAVLVLRNDRDRLSMLVYNFDAKPKDVAFRVWRLENGIYEITEGQDEDRDDSMDAVERSRTMPLARYSRVSLQVPGRVLWAVALRQKEKLGPVEQRADLAICREDIRYDSQSGAMDITVHNIGAQAAGRFEVQLRGAQGAEIGRRQVDGLEAPQDLQAQHATLRFDGLKPQADLAVRVDPEDKIAEITEENNSVQVLWKK